MSNVTPLPTKKVDLAAAVAEIRRNFENHVEYQALRAELKKSSYDQYIKQGFTKEQALELIKGELL